MNEKNKKPRELLLYFTPVYNVLIQNWFLNVIERNLAILFSSCPDGVCNWSREQLKRYCECGPYHLERAIRRLKFLHIIDIDRGGWKQSNPPRRESNTYTFQGDPYRWRVTKELQERIVAETLKLGKEPRPFEHKGFEDQLAFEISFQKSVPAYANGKKGRRKQSRDLQQSPNEPAEVQWPNTDDKKWLDRMAYILDDDLSFISLASKYYQYTDDIEVARSFHDHGFSAHKLTYLERLHYIFTERRSKLHNEEDIAVFDQIESWIDSGIPFGKISLKLESLKKEMKMSKGD